MSGFKQLIKSYEESGRPIKAIATTPAMFKDVFDDVSNLLAKQGGELQIVLSFMYPPGNIYAYSEWINHEKEDEA